VASRLLVLTCVGDAEEERASAASLESGLWECWWLCVGDDVSGMSRSKHLLSLEQGGDRWIARISLMTFSVLNGVFAISLSPVGVFPSFFL